MKEHFRTLKNFQEISRTFQKDIEHSRNILGYDSVGFQKVQNLFLSFESSNARKISLEGGGIKILGIQGWEKLGGGGFFFLQAGGELTLDDTMI